MCTTAAHCFLWIATVTQPTTPVGHPCLCGQQRWGTAEELRALDEVAALERMWASA